MDPNVCQAPQSLQQDYLLEGKLCRDGLFFFAISVFGSSTNKDNFCKFSRHTAVQRSHFSFLRIDHGSFWYTEVLSSLPSVWKGIKPSWTSLNEKWIFRSGMFHFITGRSLFWQCVPLKSSPLFELQCMIYWKHWITAPVHNENSLPVWT